MSVAAIHPSPVHDPDDRRARETPLLDNKFQTFTLVRHEGRWLCAAFRNTAMSERATALRNRRIGAPIGDRRATLRRPHSNRCRVTLMMKAAGTPITAPTKP